MFFTRAFNLKGNLPGRNQRCLVTMQPVSKVSSLLQSLKLCKLAHSYFLFSNVCLLLFLIKATVSPFPFCLMRYMQFSCKWIKPQGPETEFTSLVFINANSCVHLARLPPNFPCQTFPSETPHQL